MKNDNINKYLKEEGYPDFVVKGGMERLLKKWEMLAEDLELQKDWYDYEYINDLNSRYIIQKIIDKFPLFAEDKILARVSEVDGRIKKLLVYSGKCILSAELEREKCINRKVHWWFYGWPKFAVDKGLVEFKS